MKKSISILLCCVLILSSFSFSFAADWSTTDQTNLSNIASRLVYNGFGAARLLYDIDSTLSTISSTLNTISSRLFYNNYSISYWVNSISTWMQPIYSRLSDIITQGMNLDSIAGLLGSVDTSGSTIIRTPYLFFNNKSVANYLYDFNNFFLSSTGRTYGGWVSFNGDNISSLYTGTIQTTSGFQAMLTGLTYINSNITRGLSMLINRGLNGFNAEQTILSWSDINSSYNFTPSSGIDGIYKYLNSIQNPVARLSYVLASDQRIEAQEASAANEEAVVDNFIDSSGNGSASTNDFSSISSASDGFKTNFNSGASAGGIWDVFNSDHGNWFSQSIADSLDTSGSSNRNLKSGSSFETPFLDQQIENIYKSLGVMSDD